MSFSLLDVIILIVILIFAIIGATKGFIKAIFGKLCWILGLLGAFFFHKKLLGHMIKLVKNETVSLILCFLLLFVVIFLVVKIIQTIIEKAFDGEIMKGLDRSLGFFFGVIEGLVVVFFIVFIMMKQPWFDCSKLFEGSLIIKLLTPMLDYSNQNLQEFQEQQKALDSAKATAMLKALVYWRGERMFENLLGQEASKAIINDINNKTLPGAILFSGAACSGKLTAALELARILSCNDDQKAHWLCECPSCLRHKALNSTNLLLMGPRDCSLEISAAKDSFIKSYRDNDSHLKASRYLFLRSIRKLTLRFSGILMEGEANLSKVAVLMEKINENLELLDFPRELPPFDETVKICGELEADSLKLESDFLYDSIPVNQIRNMEKWACIRSDEGKKTVIIENAESMQVSVRNALLKILEEPPSDCVFILLTTRRNAIMETILSRVRTYNFKDRQLSVQQEVIKRVFHNEYFHGEINEFLLNFLPLPADKIRLQAKSFFDSVMHGKIPLCDSIVKDCAGFEPRVELKIFLNGIADCVRPAMASQAGSQACLELSKTLRLCYENVTLYNQRVESALEALIRELNKINVLYGKVFSSL